MPEPTFQTRPLYGDDPPRDVPLLPLAEASPVSRTSSQLRGILAFFYLLALRTISLLNRWTAGRTIWIRLLKSLGILCAFGFLTLLIIWLTLPSIDDPATLFAPQSTVILDRSGIELYRLYSEQDRTYVPSSQISEHVKRATIAIEDERFFDRGCFDVIGFGRAVISQIVPGLFIRSGGSTLTQQFAKNAVVGRRRTLLRKVRELMLACELERKYDKDQLLELYLNWIPYGHNAYGIEQAARTYFSENARELTLAQSAVLASLPQLPTYYSPYGKHVKTMLSERALSQVRSGAIRASDQIPDDDIAIGLIGQWFGSGSSAVYVGGRTDQVLKNMLDQHMIAQAEYESAAKELQALTFERARDDIRAPHFDLWVKQQVEELLGVDEQLLEQGGFQITTTIDWKLQEIAENVVREHGEDIEKRFGAHNAALIALKPGTREVLAYVGNTDYADEEHEGKIDMVRVPRQPGSSFKLFTYAAAFEQGLSPASILYDIETKFGEDEPQNFDGAFWGLMTVRSALGASRNIPAIKAFFLAGGEETVLKTAERMGAPTPLKQREQLRQESPDFSYGWPLAIGAAEIPLSEMIQGYATVADQGTLKPIVSILKITDRSGNIRFIAKEEPAEEVLDSRIAAQLTSVLSDVSARPNEYWQSILSVPGFDSAAKTGTSNKCLERNPEGVCTLRRPESTWTLGFTPSLIAGVWVGNATSQSLFEKADGLTTAAPIWHEFMTQSHKLLEGTTAHFSLPAGLNQPLVSRLSGELATGCTPVERRAPDLFLEERTPTVDDSACVLLKVDKVTGLLASPSCPEDAVEEQPFFVPKSERPDRWPLWEEALKTWTKEEMEKWNANETHSGSQLPLPLAPTEECDPSLTPGRLEKPSVEILSTSLAYPSFRPEISTEVKSDIEQIEYFLDGKTIATFAEPPFDAIVRVPRSIEEAGTHQLKVVLTDQYFNTASDEATITFQRDSASPRVKLLAPSDGANALSGAPITIIAEAEDDGGIERLQFFLDDTLLTTKRSPPYELTYTLTASPGSHRIRVVARDSAGNEGADAIQLVVTEAGVGE